MKQAYNSYLGRMECSNQNCSFQRSYYIRAQDIVDAQEKYMGAVFEDMAKHEIIHHVPEHLGFVFDSLILLKPGVVTDSFIPISFSVPVYNEVQPSISATITESLVLEEATA